MLSMNENSIETNDLQPNVKSTYFGIIQTNSMIYDIIVYM